MVRSIRAKAKAAGWSFRMAMAMAVGWVSVQATKMEAQTTGMATPAGSVAAPVTPITATAQQLVDRVARGGWDTFTTRIALRRQMVAADGTAVGPAATTTEYIWERARTANGAWKTTMTMVAAPPVSVQTRSGSRTLPKAPTVVKMEDAGDGSAPRFWDLNGAEIAMPSAERQVQVMGSRATAPGMSMADGMLRGVSGVAALPSGASNWIDAMIMPAAKRMQRLNAFERQFGQPRGMERGLRRYLRHQDDGDREVLVDAETGVPMETNLVVEGALVAHSTFAYERAASGAVLRRGMRTERVAPGGDGTRMVTEVSFSDLAVAQKGGR
jgi:hypothetical protein